jgi:hypothetical protein
MTAKNRYGIEYLVEQIARSKDYETLVQEYVDITLSLAELQAGISAGKQSRCGIPRSCIGFRQNRSPCSTLPSDRQEQQHFPDPITLA